MAIDEICSDVLLQGLCLPLCLAFLRFGSESVERQPSDGPWFDITVLCTEWGYNDDE